MKSKNQAPLVKQYLPGQVIFKEGSQGDKVYIIKEGAIKITTQQGEKMVTLAILNKGACFGEMSVISAKPRVATATAETAVEIYEIDRRQVENIIGDIPPLFRVIVNSLIKRVAKLNQFVLDKSATITPLISLVNLMHLLVQTKSINESSGIEDVSDELATLHLKTIFEQSASIMGFSQGGTQKLLDILIKFKLIKVDQETLNFNPCTLLSDTQDLIHALESTTHSDLAAEIEYIDLKEFARQFKLEPNALLDSIRMGRISLDAVVLKQSIVKRCMEEQGRQSFY